MRIERVDSFNMSEGWSRDVSVSESLGIGEWYIEEVD